MQAPQNNVDLGNASSSDRELKLEAMDLLTQFNTNSHDLIAKEQARLHVLKWQKISTRHLKAWQSAEEMWQLMSDIKPKLSAVSVSKHSDRNQKKYFTGFFIPACVAASLLLVLIMPNLFNTHSKANIAVSHQNKVLDIIEKQYTNQWQTQNRVLLPDNSIAYLNFNSAIKISFDSSIRQIELLRGEVFFKVAKNPKRPFVVKTGNITASALGTEFLVRRQNHDLSSITVTEGVVKVALHPEYGSENKSTKQSNISHAAIGSSIILMANESVTSSSEKIGDIKKVSTQSAGSWRRGILIFKDTPLQQVLAEIDRYTPYNIEAKLGYRYQEKITGTFFIKRLDEELKNLIITLNLAVINNSNGQLTLALPAPKRLKY